jgi:hypothetical protein
MSLTVAGLYPIDLGRITLAFGFEVGWVLVRQSYSPTDLATYGVMPPSTSLIHPRWSDGLQLGPLAQLDLPLSQKAYLRLEAAFPYRQFSRSFSWSPTEDFHRGLHMHVVAGAGMTF